MSPKRSLTTSSTFSPGVIGEQGGQAFSEEVTGCSADTHAHQPHRRGALSSKRRFDSLDAVQYWRAVQTDTKINRAGRPSR